MNGHIGDDAELYALGTLEPDERTRVEEHLAHCAECTQSVARAERVVAALENIDWDEIPVARVAPAVPRSRYALAAAFLLAIGLGGALVGERGYVATLVANDDLALSTIATSHFLHVPFTPSQKNALSAKALYARDGSWLYVVVDARHDDWHVTGVANGASQSLGVLEVRGTTSVLFVRPATRFRALTLTDGNGQAVAKASPVYPGGT